MLQTASDFEKVERELSSEDPTHFNKIILSDFIEILSPSLLVNYSLNLVSTIVSDRMQIDSDVWKQIQKQILKLPEDVKLAGDTLKWIEKLYDKTPDWLTHGFDVFLPETLKDAYTITSGLLQGNIKMDECWDVAKNIFSSNPKYAIVCETVEYALDKGEKRSKEMERQMLEQLKEGDILGTVFEGAEGFVDTIIGGTIEVLCDVTGNAVDEIPVVKNISQFVEYGTGVFGWNDGDGYSLGGLIGQTGESIAEGIDGITDIVTDATDVVTYVPLCSSFFASFYAAVSLEKKVKLSTDTLATCFSPANAKALKMLNDPYLRPFSIYYAFLPPSDTTPAELDDFVEEMVDELKNRKN